MNIANLLPCPIAKFIIQHLTKIKNGYIIKVSASIINKNIWAHSLDLYKYIQVSLVTIKTQLINKEAIAI